MNSVMLKWSDIKTIQFSNGLVVNMYMDIIKHQIRLWMKNIKSGLYIEKEEVQVIISYLCSKANIDNKKVINVFEKLGKYIYTRYGEFIELYNENVLEFITLLNKLGLGINKNLIL